MKVKTIVWVRWNLPLGPPHESRNIVRERAGWNAERLRLWRRYCMASLLRQTHGQFEVWLLCDPALDRWNRELAATFPDDRFQVVCDSHTVAARMSGADQYIFARIDSDDVYGDDALATYASAATDMGDKRYVQCEEGWVFDEQSGRIWEWNNPSPAFFALVTGPDGLDTYHPHLAHHGRIRPESVEIIGRRMFVVICHGGNVCNRPRGRWVGQEMRGAQRDAVAEEFGLAPR